MRRSSNNYVSVVSLVISLLLGACGMVDTPVGVSKQFLSSIDKGKVDAAIDCLSPRMVNQFGVEKLRSGFSEQALQVKRKGGIDSMKVTREDVVGDVAEIQIQVTYGDGSTDTEDFKLAKENGDWKIQLPK